jgi:hypothetical protein
MDYLQLKRRPPVTNRYKQPAAHPAPGDLANPFPNSEVRRGAALPLTTAPLFLPASNEAAAGGTGTSPATAPTLIPFPFRASL